MNGVEVEPITGKRVFLPPGRVAIRLDERYRRAYHRLFGLYFPLAGVPELRDDDFDGHALKFTRRQLAALNHAFASLDRREEPGLRRAFGGQEHSLTERSREMQFLS